MEIEQINSLLEFSATLFLAMFGGAFSMIAIVAVILYFTRNIGMDKECPETPFRDLSGHDLLSDGIDAPLGGEMGVAPMLMAGDIVNKMYHNAFRSTERMINVLAPSCTVSYNKTFDNDYTYDSVINYIRTHDAPFSKWLVWWSFNREDLSIKLSLVRTFQMNAKKVV